MYSSRILFYTILCVRQTGLLLEHNFIDCFVNMLHERPNGPFRPGAILVPNLNEYFVGVYVSLP